jgi:peptide/nickel transport system substrate-binding protein
MRLRANPDWPGESPAFELIQLRFYDDAGRMRRSLENNALDMAWTGLPYAEALDLRGNPAYRFWDGPSTFKSYLVFDHKQEPWDDARVREAISYAVDRQALAQDVFAGARFPLFSPVPDSTPGHLATEPARDLESARTILLAAGLSEGKKLEMTLWYVNDGRYGPLEQTYAEVIERQLEETGLIEVTLEGAPWNVFRPQSLTCNYPAFLLGWPPLNQPANYLDAMSWMDYFITQTDRVCSNYESPRMTALLESAQRENDLAARLEIYRQMQELWAQELPTLDLTQERRAAVSLANVRNVVIDATGLMHYDRLTKAGG